MTYTLTQDLIAEPQPVGMCLADWVRAAVARVDSHSHPPRPVPTAALTRAQP